VTRLRDGEGIREGARADMTETNDIRQRAAKAQGRYAQNDRQQRQICTECTNEFRSRACELGCLDDGVEMEGFEASQPQSQRQSQR
jgi:exopolyphosphatase/pppGpp-phosphohydrolase